MLRYDRSHEGESAKGKSFVECLREDWVPVVKTTRIVKKDGEYRVKLYYDGEYQPEADYFTNDKEDAVLTAKLMCQSKD